MTIFHPDLKDERRVDIEVRDADGDMVYGLNYIGVEQCSVGMSDVRELGNILNRADFIVCEHDRNDRRARCLNSCPVV